MVCVFDNGVGFGKSTNCQGFLDLHMEPQVKMHCIAYIKLHICLTVVSGLQGVSKITAPLPRFKQHTTKSNAFFTSSSNNLTT